jgi:putative flippase GtrA
MIVLIPSYEPDGRLLELVRALRASTTYDILIVDDGSGPAYAPVFAAARELGAWVCTHAANRGKGAALRTGFAHLAAHHPGRDVVCADADGQHTPADIRRVAAALHPSDTGAGPDMVLGVRHFTGRVPARSRFGNAVTTRLFGAVTRLPVVDTQTGLRAYPARLLSWLRGVPGDRFEYELRLLLRAARERLTVRQVPIATVYLEENTSSHFRPVRDSVRIYAPFLAYGLSSFAGFAVDVALLWLLAAATGSLTASVVGARLVSGAVNFTVNRVWVFTDGGRAPLRAALLRYVVLTTVLLAANLTLLSALVGIGVPLFWAKLGTEAALFTVGFVAQKVAVFSPLRRPEKCEPSAAKSRDPLSASATRVIG